MLEKYFKKHKKVHSKKSAMSLDMPFLSFSNEERAGVESYKSNSIVHRCVSLIATSASHIPWQIYKESGGARTLLQNHPSASLLKNPNPDKSGADFFTESI